jgi:cytochrome c biogenesis protein CcmG/thiol:disulfide interchange protein DsbE
MVSMILLSLLPGTAQDQAQRGTDPSVAPDFALIDFEGRLLTLSDYKGKTVLLNFWASWCVPCQAEIPRFLEWQRRYGDQGLQVIGMSMDDDEKSARKFASRLKVNYPLAMATEKLAASYGGVLGLPATFIIDRDGKIVAKYVGVTDLEVLKRRIQSQLALK